MKKKITVLTLWAMHSALCFRSALLLSQGLCAVLFLALCSVLLAPCSSVQAQEPKKVPRIGILSFGSGDPRGLARRGTDAFQRGLHELGWVDGKNIAFEYRWANESEDRLFELAAELVRINVDIILVTTPRAANAAKKLTQSIPIVVTVIPGPGQYGLVQSLSQPGGNVTGLSFMPSQLAGRRLELLKEVIPAISRVALLRNLDWEGSTKEIESVAHSLSVQIQFLDVKKPEEIANAFSAAVRGKAEAITLGSHAMFVLNRTRIVELAAKSRLPVIYNRSEFVEAGGFMSYGPNHTDLYRRAATYVDKILKGAKPADLPVEQPTKFEFVINLKAAKEIGVTIPLDVLMWADRVIK
jgi:putative tryptophan/tyrosine transport system substrate-binding protein